MKDIYINRLNAFGTALDFLRTAENLLLWENQPPLIFTDKVGEAQIIVQTLRTAQQKQETDLEGYTEEKSNEEDELEAADYILAQALVTYFDDLGQASAAAPFRLSATKWSELRDQTLLAKSQLVIDAADALVQGPDSATALRYGITAAAVTELTKERQDYADIINAPSVEISIRKALGKGFQPAFAIAETKFKQLDRLIPQFGKTADGKLFVAGWKNARAIKDAGHGPKPPPPAPIP